MTAPEARPSSDPQPEQAFNFRVMSDEAVIFLGRALELAIEREYLEGRDWESPEEAVQPLYVSAMAALLEQDPDRAKAILKHQALSDDGWDERVAVLCTLVLAEHDFPLARDIVVYAQREHDVGHESGDVEELAMGIGHQMGNSVTAEQAANLTAAQDLVWQDRTAPFPVPPGLAT